VEPAALPGADAAERPGANVAALPGADAAELAGANTAELAHVDAATSLNKVPVSITRHLHPDRRRIEHLC